MLLIVAAVVGALTPAVVKQIQHARVNRAASVVAADFFLCQSLAGRQHGPILYTIDTVGMTATVASPHPTLTTLYVRQFGVTSEFKLSTLSATVAAIQVLPNGRSSSTVIVTVGAGGYTRQVRMTRAGQIRLL